MAGRQPPKHGRGKGPMRGFTSEPNPDTPSHYLNTPADFHYDDQQMAEGTESNPIIISESSTPQHAMSEDSGSLHSMWNSFFGDYGYGYPPQTAPSPNHSIEGPSYHTPHSSPAPTPALPPRAPTKPRRRVMPGVTISIPRSPVVPKDPESSEEEPEMDSPDHMEEDDVPPQQEEHHHHSTPPPVGHVSPLPPLPTAPYPDFVPPPPAYTTAASYNMPDPSFNPFYPSYPSYASSSSVPLTDPYLFNSVLPDPVPNVSYNPFAPSIFDPHYQPGTYMPYIPPQPIMTFQPPVMPVAPVLSVQQPVVPVEPVPPTTTPPLVLPRSLSVPTSDYVSISLEITKEMRQTFRKDKKAKGITKYLKKVTSRLTQFQKGDEPPKPKP